jgi:type II secretory pathway component PulK
LAVLVVVLLLTLAAYQFSELMLAEYKAADSYTRSAQAKALADSGVHYAAALLSNATTRTSVLSNNPFSNPQYFQGIVVNPQALPRLQGRFSILAPVDPTDPNASAQPFRFGVIDESGKINLNALLQIDSSGQVAHDMLMTFPNITEDIVNSMLDWIDADEDARPNGAESDYYSSQSPSYQAKNGPLTSIEELLFVKGVTPQLLLGNDQNRNGVIDPEEDDGSGAQGLGWAAYLTPYSREQNVDSQGNPRINVNNPDLTTLYNTLSSVLGQDLANFIIAYRVYGPAPAASGGSGRTGTGPGNNPGSGGGASRGGGGNAAGTMMTISGGPAGGVSFSVSVGGTGAAASGSRLSRNQINFQGGRPRSISSLYELINAQVSIPGTTPQSPATIYPSPLNDPGSQRQLLPLLLDECTTLSATEIPARINVNTASQAVLLALPNIAQADVQSILAHRPSPTSTDAPDPIFQTPAWLITEANLSVATVRALDRYITTQSQVYRVQVIGYFDSGGPSARVEAVIDTNQGAPRILYYRDLTELGKGFPQAMLTNGAAGSR